MHPKPRLAGLIFPGSLLLFLAYCLIGIGFSNAIHTLATVDQKIASLGALIGMVTVTLVVVQIVIASSEVAIVVRQTKILENQEEILLRRADLFLTFAGQKSSFTGQARVDSRPGGLSDGKWVYEHSWRVSFALFIHNRGKRTAESATLRLAVPAQHHIENLKSEEDYATIGNQTLQIFVVHISEPVYPGIPCMAGTWSLGRNVGVSQQTAPGIVDAGPVVYWQIGHADGVSPERGVWEPLTFRVSSS